MPDRTDLRVTDLVVYLVAVVVLSGSLTVLWLSMRAVMDIGGTCASGGPYVVAVECPQGVAWLLPLSILAGVIGVGLVAWFGGRVGPGFVAVAALAWPALFLSLGWNFLEYGLASPGGWDVSWLLCGALFMAMGGIPLLIGIRGLQGSRSSTRPPGGSSLPGEPPARRGGVTIRTATPGTASAPGTSSAIQQHVELARLLRQVQGVAVAEAAEVTVGEAMGTDPPGHADLVDQLERLAKLKQQGAIGELEYLQAKQAVIDAAARAGAT
jgi:hypothetical protein